MFFSFLLPRSRDPQDQDRVLGEIMSRVRCVHNDSQPRSHISQQLATIRLRVSRDRSDMGRFNETLVPILEAINTKAFSFQKKHNKRESPLPRISSSIRVFEFLVNLLSKQKVVLTIVSLDVECISRGLHARLTRCISRS